MILFLYGDNDFMIRREMNRIREHYQNKVDSTLSVESFDLVDCSIGRVIDALEIAPLFASSRLIEVNNLAKNKLAQEQIDTLITAADGTNVCILNGAGMDRRSRAFKTLASLPKAVEFKTLTPTTLTAWVKKEARRLGGEIDTATANYLIEKVGSSQWSLSNELVKLTSFSTQISRKTIDNLVSTKTEATIFLLIESITQDDLSQSMKIYNHLQLSGVSDQQIIAMFNWHYRNIVLAIANQNQLDFSWSSKFAISPYALKKAATIARRMNLIDCRDAYRLIVATDEAIKSGQKSSREAILDLIYQLSSP